jgi:hypothetical protein
MEKSQLSGNIVMNKSPIAVGRLPKLTYNNDNMNNGSLSRVPMRNN